MTSDLGKELTASSATPLLLALLAQGENYGYALIRRISTLSGGRIHWSEGMLYPVLHRLEKQGFITARWDRPAGERRRRYYRITTAGREELVAWKRRWTAVDDTLRKIDIWREVKV